MRMTRDYEAMNLYGNDYETETAAAYRRDYLRLCGDNMRGGADYTDYRRELAGLFTREYEGDSLFAGYNDPYARVCCA